MPSDAHEELIDDVRHILVTSLRQLHPEPFTPGGFAVMVDAPALDYNGPGRAPAADLYVLPDDGAGIIMVEVGRMPDGKWSNWTAEDERPPRVVRIGFDRSVSIIRPRHTPFEQDMLRCLESEL